MAKSLRFARLSSLSYCLINMAKSGVYVHIPFCRSRCSYCDFATGMYESAMAERYVAAVTEELRAWNEVEAVAVDTIYFGGGTPSLLSPSQIERILKTISDRFNVLAGAEVTLEINPGTVTEGAHHRDTENTEGGTETTARPELSRKKLA